MSQLVRILQDFWPDNSGMLSAYYRNPGRIIQESWPSVTGTLAGCYKNNHFCGEPKGLLKSLRDEFAERSAEEEAFDKAVFEEKRRLEAAREEARKKNIFRKIKFIDNKISQEEYERDEVALRKFRESERSKIATARIKRNSSFVKEKRKSIAILLSALIVTVCAAGGFANHSHNVAMAKDYDMAVSYILAEDYDKAADLLHDVHINDSDALYDYAYEQSRIDYYEGMPENMLEAISGIDGIENGDVKQQQSQAIEEIQFAGEIQKDIESLDLESVDSISRKTVKKIKKREPKLKKRYAALLDTENYEIASKVLYNVKNETAAGKLIDDLDDLGDVSLKSKKRIKKLRKAYDNLSEEDQKTILNYSILTSAESKYTKLKKAEDKRVAEEKKKAEKEKKKAEEKAKRENPPQKYASDFIMSDTESYDFGYVKVRARVNGYNRIHPGLWDFVILNENDSTVGGEWIHDIGIPESMIPADYMNLYNQCMSSYEEEENYVFTLYGEASWKPMREGSSGANTVADLSV